MLPLVLEYAGLHGAQCALVCKSWRLELESRGFCSKTVQLYSALVEGYAPEFITQKMFCRLCASTNDAERTFCEDALAFLQGCTWTTESASACLQIMAQEPDASLLSRGARSTAQILGVPLIQWVGKPQGRYPGLYFRRGRGRRGPGYNGSGISRDGKFAVCGTGDKAAAIWDVERGAQVPRSIPAKSQDVDDVRWDCFMDVWLLSLNHWRVWPRSPPRIGSPPGSV